MRYGVVLPKKAQKDLQRVDSRYRRRICAALEALGSDPYCGKKLEGEFRGYFSYRVWPYRIIYTLQEDHLIVLIIRIGHRQGVYG